MRSQLLALALLVLGSWGCGTTQAGQCKDYTPIDMCSEGYRYECETTDEGCEQCGCVPTAPDHGPVRPGPNQR